MKRKKVLQTISVLYCSLFASCADQIITIDIEPDISTHVSVKYKYDIPIGEYALLPISNPDDNTEYEWVSENAEIASCKNDTIFAHRVGITRIMNANVIDVLHEITVNVTE